MQLIPKPHGFLIPVEGKHPIDFIATQKLADSTDAAAFEQAINAAHIRGVERVVLGADCHSGFGVPVGCIIASKSIILPATVGPDISCSMSYIRFNLHESAIKDVTIRRKLIHAIQSRIPTGPGNRKAPLGRKIREDVLLNLVGVGAAEHVLRELGIPVEWASKLESSRYGEQGENFCRTEKICDLNGKSKVLEKLSQLGSYGGGNHMGEAQAVDVVDNDIARSWGLHQGEVGFLSHCGSRGFGYMLSSGKFGQFATLEKQFDKWNIPLPGGDKHLVYAPIDSIEGQNYISDMHLGANFAIVNHLLINALVLEAFQEVFPGVKGDLLYHISHNLNRKEIIDNVPHWIHRKGATRAFPAFHHDLKETPFYGTGHPILLPGNPKQGSKIMVANKEAANFLYSINHGAGRAMGRKQAERTLNQKDVDRELFELDILSNCRLYPVDEAPAAYKDFNEVCGAVEQARLASTVANLRARFVIKDAGVPE